MPLDDDVYDALYSILSGAKSLNDWAKKGDKGLRQRVYRKLKSGIYAYQEIHDPLVGKMNKRIVEKATNCIVVKKSEVSQLVDCAYDEAKGEGAKKLTKRMSQLYSGLSRQIIQQNLNSLKQQQKVRPHQADLVSMARMPDTIDGDTYTIIYYVSCRHFKRFLLCYVLFKQRRVVK